MSLLQSRRNLLITGVALGAFGLPHIVRAGSAAIGTTMAVRGQGQVTRANVVAALKPQDDLHEGDQIATGADSFAMLELFTQTRINLGPDSRFGIDRFVADLGGEITIGGAMVFDRPDDLPKLDLTLRNTFAQIGVRGTRFFAGPSKGVFSVFVDRGVVQIAAGGQTVELRAGEGVEVAVAGGPPGAVAQWKPARINDAFAGVGL